MFALRRHFPIRLRSWRFECSHFVVTFWLDCKDDVSNVRPSSSLSDKTTKMTFWVFALRRHFPNRLRRCCFECLHFAVTFRLDYENDVSRVSPSSERVKRGLTLESSACSSIQGGNCALNNLLQAKAYSYQRLLKECKILRMLKSIEGVCGIRP